MNIFINQSSFDILNARDGNIYYIDNQNNSVNITLSNLEHFARISLHLLHRNLNDCKINTSKGNYILNRENPSITLIFYENESWIPVDHQMALPFQSNTFKQELNIKMFDNGRMGQNLLILGGGTGEAIDGSDGKYKISNLILTSIPNFHNGLPVMEEKTKINPKNGEGCVMVSRIDSSNSYVFESMITPGSESIHPMHKGNFGRHIKILSMGNYDYLIVSAPTKVRNSDPRFENMGYFYIYSYRKNIDERYYFHLEKQIPFPSFSELVDLSGNFRDRLNYQSIFQLDTIDGLGFIFLSSNSNLFTYRLDNLENIRMAKNTIFKPNFIKANGNKIYLSKDDKISISQTDTFIFPEISNTLLTPISLSNSENLEAYGRIIFPYSSGLVVISRFDFLDYDSNYQLKKRITFQNQIFSFDLFEINSNQRKYCFLTDAKENNVYIMDQNYYLIANDIYKVNEDDMPTLIRWDPNGQSIFICCPDNNDYINQIQGVGSVARFDLFFDKENKNIPDLFPSFDVDNELFLQRKIIQTGQEINYLEDLFYNLPLISNQSSSSKSVERIYPVVDNSGILIELNYNVSDESFLSQFAKYFIYSIPTADKILSNNNQYLGWNDFQMLEYNDSEFYEIYSYFSNNQIKIVLLGISNDNTQQQSSIRRWNLIESEMTLDPFQSLHPIQLIQSGELDMDSFIRLEKIIHPGKVYFLIYFEKRIVVIDYFENSIQTYNFENNIESDLFYLDSFKNLFHLFKESSNAMLSIYQRPDRVILSNQKMDLLDMPKQILGQYLNQSFVLVENYLTDIQVRKLDLNFSNPSELIQFDELNISNQFQTEKWVLDIDWNELNIEKLILSNYSDRNFRFFHKFTQEIFAVPTLAKTRFDNRKKLYVRQLYVNEKNYLHYEQYEIKDELPKLFYNTKYQKYFGNKFGLFVEYQFRDDKDLIISLENIVQLNKQNNNSFTKYLFYPDNGNNIVNYVYDASTSLVSLTEKGATGCNFKIYDVQDGIYDFVSRTGDATGKLIAEKKFIDSSDNLGFESLDIRQGKLFISETFDVSNQSIGFWIYDHPTKDLSRNQITLNSLSLTKDSYLYQSPYEEFFLNQSFPEIRYFKKVNGIFQPFTISFSKSKTGKLDILFIEHFMILSIDHTSYLFVRNNNNDIWTEFGEQVYHIEDKNALNFELERYYSIDLDIQATLTTFMNTNVNLQSKFFGDQNKNIYCLLNQRIYKIKLSHPLLDYYSFSNDGSQIYTQNDSSKNLISLPMSNSPIVLQDVSNVLFCPSVYSNWKVDISNNGYFTMIKDGLGVSKNYVFQPLISRKYQTTDFPLIDVSQNVFVSENNYIYTYQKNGNQLLLDSSKNLTNFEMVIDSDETFFTSSKFGNIYYKEVNYQTGLTNFNSFSDSLPIFSSLSPDGKQFLIYQNLYLMFFKENLFEYPDKYWFEKSLPISNSIQYHLNTSKIPKSFLVNWSLQKIYLGFGSLGGKSTVSSKVSILNWNQNEFIFEQDISGGFSFGYDLQFSKDKKYLFISEPRYGWDVSGMDLSENQIEEEPISPEKIPDSSGVFQGAIHIYEIDNSGNYQFQKMLRSRLTNIGYKLKVSNDNKKLLTIGYSRGSEPSELVIFDKFLTHEVKEIKMSMNVYDMCFMGETNQILVEEKLIYSEGANVSRYFYLLDEVNGCENIITKVATNHPFLIKDTTLFELRSFGKNFILLIFDKAVHLMQINQYKMKYITSLARNSNSYLALSEDHRTMLETNQTRGLLQLFICW